MSNMQQVSHSRICGFVPVPTLLDMLYLEDVAFLEHESKVNNWLLQQNSIAIGFSTIV